MSLLPAKWSFAAWEGSTFRKTITVLTAGVGSNPRDLTNYTAAMTIRTAPDTTPVFTLTTENGRIAIGGEAGTINLYISAADTSTFDTWESGIYELSLTAPGINGDVEAVLWGSFRAQGIS